jgi:endoglucanase
VDVRALIIALIALAATPAAAQAELFVDPHSPAARQARAYAKHGRPHAAELMRRMSRIPQAAWMTGGSRASVRRAVAKLMRRAGDDLPVLVAYDLPRRGCRAKGYGRWIDGFARGIGAHRAIVIVEPDALASGCGAGALGPAVKRLRRAKRARVYVDAGHSDWLPASTMARRLEQVHAHAFSLNVSNFRRTPELIEYGEKVARRLNGAHFVIDTSRNGRGPAATWCNPRHRGLGARPTTETGKPLVDALLWIKVPGESDGTCNGGPPAGRWWPGYALGLARRASPKL